MRCGYEIAVSAARDSGLWIREVNYLTAILCGLALLVAQYFVGRGPYPFLPLPAYAVLCLAGLSCAWQVMRREFAVPRWQCISFAAALVAWIAIPLAGQLIGEVHGVSRSPAVSRARKTFRKVRIRAITASWSNC